MDATEPTVIDAEFVETKAPATLVEPPKNAAHSWAEALLGVAKTIGLVAGQTEGGAKIEATVKSAGEATAAIGDAVERSRPLFRDVKRVLGYYRKSRSE